MDKRIIVLLAIVVILAAVFGYLVFSQHQEPVKQVVNNTTPANNTTVKNATVEDTTTESSSSSESGQYGYCAVCGKALTYSEAHSEYTQGKVCRDCGSNPYYQTDEGSKYANQKLQEAYPEEYSWMSEESSDVEYEDN